MSEKHAGGNLKERLLRPITMSDIRLAAGEGKFTADQMLDACNAVLRGRTTDALIDLLSDLEKAIPDHVKKDAALKLASEALREAVETMSHVDGENDCRKSIDQCEAALSLLKQES